MNDRCSYGQCRCTGMLQTRLGRRAGQQSAAPRWVCREHLRVLEALHEKRLADNKARDLKKR